MVPELFGKEPAFEERAGIGKGKEAKSPLGLFAKKD